MVRVSSNRLNRSWVELFKKPNSLFFTLNDFFINISIGSIFILDILIYFDILILENNFDIFLLTL